jgi:O-antigen/teichoic acid export membrane protein
VIGAPLLISTLYDKRYDQAGYFLSLLGIGLILYPFSIASNLLFADLRYKRNALINLLRVLFLAAFVAVGVVRESINIVVAAIALQRVPEYLLYSLHLRTKLNIRWFRDGMLVLLAAACLMFHFGFSS